MDTQLMYASDIWRASAMRMRRVSIAFLLTITPIVAALQYLG